MPIGWRHGRDRGHQHLRIGLLRAAQHIVTVAIFDNLAVLHHDDPVGDFCDDTKVMGDEQNAGSLALLHFLDQLQDLRLRCDIQRRGRFIRNQKRGIKNQRHGDHDPLALSARELVRIAIHHALGIRQMNGIHNLNCPRAPLAGRKACVNFQNFGDLFTDARNRVQGGHRFLKDHRHLGAAQVSQAGFAGL